MSYLSWAALALVVVGLAAAFHVVRRAGYRDGLARAVEILLESWTREPRAGAAVLEPGAMGEALRKIIALVGGRPGKRTAPVVSPPSSAPCEACSLGEHRACRGGFLDAGGRAACGCGCPADLA